MRAGDAWRRVARLALVLVLAGAGRPGRGRAPDHDQPDRGRDAPRPSTSSDGVVWVLAARLRCPPGRGRASGNTDAIQLSASTSTPARPPASASPATPGSTSRAMASDRINAAAATTADRTWSADGGRRPGRHRSPTTCSLAGLRRASRTWSTPIGGVDGALADGLRRPRVRPSRSRGAQRLRRHEALDYARTRDTLPAQRLRPVGQPAAAACSGILRRLRAQEDEAGFMERGDAGGAGRASRPTSRRPSSTGSPRRSPRSARTGSTTCVLDRHATVTWDGADVRVPRRPRRRAAARATTPRTTLRCDDGC